MNLAKAAYYEAFSQAKIANGPQFSLKPLTTNDAIWHHLTLATCYLFAQSVLKTLVFALAK